MTPSIYKQLCEEEKRLGEELTDLRNYLSKYHKTFGEVVAPIPQVQTSLSLPKVSNRKWPTELHSGITQPELAYLALYKYGELEGEDVTKKMNHLVPGTFPDEEAAKSRTKTLLWLLKKEGAIRSKKKPGDKYRKFIYYI